MQTFVRLSILESERQQALKRLKRREGFCRRKGLNPDTDEKVKAFRATCHDRYLRILSLQGGADEEYYHRLGGVQIQWKPTQGDRERESSDAL